MSATRWRDRSACPPPLPARSKTSSSGGMERGHPRRRQGDEIALPARIVAVADVLELAFSRFGLEGAVEIARRRSAGRFDPGLVDTFCAHASDLLEGLGVGSVWDLFLDSEPPRRNVTAAVVATYAEAFARAVDLKSVWTAAHSHTVGVVAAAAGQAAGLERASVEQLRIAGWLHDLGRVAISNLVWDKPGPLNAAEWEQVRMHAPPFCLCCAVQSGDQSDGRRVIRQMVRSCDADERRGSLPRTFPQIPRRSRCSLGFTVSTTPSLTCDFSALGGTRTPNLLIRSQMLFPIELRARGGGSIVPVRSSASRGFSSRAPDLEHAGP